MVYWLAFDCKWSTMPVAQPHGRCHAVDGGEFGTLSNAQHARPIQTNGEEEMTQWVKPTGRVRRMPPGTNVVFLVQ